MSANVSFRVRHVRGAFADDGNDPLCHMRPACSLIPAAAAAAPASCLPSASRVIAEPERPGPTRPPKRTAPWCATSGCATDTALLEELDFDVFRREDLDEEGMDLADACRNNPFERMMSLTRGGLGSMSPRGGLVAYSTEPGDTATDNGLYTRQLVAALRVPGLPAMEL